MQDSCSPAYFASENGRTETLALLLSNNADVNAASKVQRIKTLLCSEINWQRHARLIRGFLHVINCFSQGKQEQILMCLCSIFMQDSYTPAILSFYN